MPTRRVLLSAALAGAAGTTRTRAARAQVAPALRISTAAPPSDHLTRALEAMRAGLDTGGAGLAVTVHPASTLFRQGTEVQALQRGNLEMSTMTTFEVAQQMPAFGLFNRGYIFRDYPHMRRVFDGPIGADYAAAVAEKMGIVILATHYLGTRHVNLRQKRAVTGPESLAGIKMRMPAGPEWLTLGRAIGVSPAPLGMPEVYLALKTGTIDGQENPLSILNAAKFYEVTEQVALTAHLIQPVFISIAKPVWDKLSPDQQQALREGAKAAAGQGDTARLAEEATIVEQLRGRGLSVDAVDLAAFRANADRVYAEASKAWDPAMTRRVTEA